MAGERVEKGVVGQELPECLRKEALQLVRRCPDFRNDLPPAVQDCDEVLHVVTGHIIAVPAAFEGLDLGRQEIRRGDQPNGQVALQEHWGGVFDGGQVPAVGEPQYLFLGRHDIDLVRSTSQRQTGAFSVMSCLKPRCLSSSSSR